MMQMGYLEQYGHPLDISSLGLIESIAVQESTELMPRLPTMSNLVEAYLFLEALENLGIRGEEERYHEYSYRIIFIHMVRAILVLSHVSC